jgi:glycerate 2-kinase
MDQFSLSDRASKGPESLPLADARRLLKQAFESCVRAAHPVHLLPPYLAGLPRARRTIVVGAGKASAAMAAATETHLDRPLEGMVLTRYGHGSPTDRIRVIEAGHPVPDEAGRTGTDAIIDVLRGATPEDLIVGLFSGGGSALLCAPVPPLTLLDKRAVNEALLASGLPIADMNRIRKHLSRVKGGEAAIIRSRRADGEFPHVGRTGR